MTVILLAALAAQPPKKAVISDVNTPTEFSEKVYVAKSSLTIAKPTSFAAGTIVYMPPGSSVKILAPIRIVDKPTEETPVPMPVTFVAEKGKPWKGLTLDAGVSLERVQVVGAENGVVVANVAATLKDCSFINCGIGVKVLRNDNAKRVVGEGKKAKTERVARPLLLSGCWIQGARKTGVYMDDVSSADFEHCSIIDCAEGLLLRHTNTAHVSNSVIARNGVGVKSQWQENNLKVENSNIADNRVSVFMSSKKDIDLSGNFWGGPVRIQYGSEAGIGAVDSGNHLKKPAEGAGSSIVQKKLPKFR